MDRLRIRHVRLLDVIHRRGSLGAAAKELALSQPAVTLMLRELELVFGASLVERDVRGGRLTLAGLRALERLNAALSGLEHAVASSRSGGLEPPLRIGCAQVVGISVLPRAIAYLGRDASVMPMRIVEGEAIVLLKELVAGRLDCVVAWMDESVSAQHSLELFDITPLWKGRMQVVAAADHPLALLRNVPMEVLIAAVWLMPRPGSRTFAAFLKQSTPWRSSEGRIPG
jgi:molybdate transport repressor ModE-like protein